MHCETYPLPQHPPSRFAFSRNSLPLFHTQTTTSMTESGDSSTARLRRPSTPPPDHHRRRRRRCRLCAALTCLLLLALAILALILGLTVFRVRNPTTQVVSARVTGVSPRVSLPAIRVEINVSLDLTIHVYNPNRAAFAHSLGKSQLYYRGDLVGEADVLPGRIPARGTEEVRVLMTVEADRFEQELRSLVSDVIAGEVALDSTASIPGRVTILGFIKRHAVATSKCHIVVGVPDLRVRSQECTHKTKL